MDTLSDREKLAYLGGLFDGEGYTHLGITGLQIGIEMKDLEPLELMCDYFGGNIRETPARKTSNPLHALRYSGRSAINILTQLLPWLLAKNIRISLIIEYYKNWDVLSRAGREGLIERFNNEEVVKAYRKPWATGRPKGSSNINKHKVTKKGYRGRNNPLLVINIPDG